MKVARNFAQPLPALPVSLLFLSGNYIIVIASFLFNPSILKRVSAMNKKLNKSTLLKIAKISGYTLGGIFLFILLLPLIINPILKSQIIKQGKKFTNCEVELRDIKLSLLRGSLQLDGLVLRNPEGYKTDYAFSLNQLKVKTSLRSLLTDTIIVNEILIDSPEAIWEVGLGNSNFGKIIENIKNNTAPTPESTTNQPQMQQNDAQTPPKPAIAEGTDTSETDREDQKAKGKKLIIEHLRISGTKVRLSAKLLGGANLPIPIPTIDMTDIGKNDNSASWKDTVVSLYTQIANTIMNCINSAGGAIMDGVDSASGAIMDGVDSASGAIMDGVDSASGAIMDGVKGVGNFFSNFK